MESTTTNDASCSYDAPAGAPRHASGVLRDAGGMTLANRDVLLFDFDGTLANTTACVMRTVRRVLAARGFTQKEMGDLSRFVGPPLVAAFRDIYGFSQTEAQQVTAEYRAAFDECTAKDYPAFEGLHDMLDELVARGTRLAVATSRLESRAKTMMEELAFTQFDVAYGLNPPARMTKADAVRDTLAALGGDATNALMVGDSHFDVEGATAFGIPCIGVTYGGTSTEDALMAAGAVAVAHTVEELRAMLLGSTEHAGMLRYHAWSR